MSTEWIKSLKKLFATSEKPKTNPPEIKKTASVSSLPKEAATRAGEPWVGIVKIDLDPENPEMGAFELDWNDIFVARLVKAGYIGKTDQEIVDMWFKTICQSVADEIFEQEMADPEKRAQEQQRRKDLGGGYSEIS